MQHIGSPTGNRMIPHGFVVVGRFFTVPVAIAFAIVEWIVRDVLVRALGMLVVVLVSLSDEVHRARLLAQQRRILREVDAQMRVEVHRRRARFVQTLQAVAHADLDHARFEPMFEESLKTAQVVYRQQLQTLQDFGRDGGSPTSQRTDS